MVELREASIADVAELARIPIAFTVERVYDVHADDAPMATAPGDAGPGGFTLTERAVDVPYVKDYDRIEGEGPSQWASRHDIRHWGFLQVGSSRQLLGGAVVAFRTPALSLLEGRSDLAAVWDIRVAPDMRGRGLGAMLFQAAEEWAGTRGCIGLRVETQNINVPACRFYRRQGCVLSSVNVGAYPSLPEEVQLIWSKALQAPEPGRRGLRER